MLCLLNSGMIVMAVSPRIADIAFDAYRKYGKGSGHEAALNYGDCFSYASAKYLAAPLLFNGDDFSKTDLRLATFERTEHQRPVGHLARGNFRLTKNFWPDCMPPRLKTARLGDQLKTALSEASLG